MHARAKDCRFGAPWSSTDVVHAGLHDGGTEAVPLVLLRPGELRAAEWAEIALDIAAWRIPASKMKMKNDHLVPLSAQAVAILRGIHPMTDQGKYVFPGIRAGERCMSENTVTAALCN
jgi:integrase